MKRRDFLLGVTTYGVAWEGVLGEFRKRPEFMSFQFGTIRSYVRHFHSGFACDRHHHPARSTRWAPLRCCRIRLDTTSSPDSESRAEAGSEPSVVRSHRRRFVHPLHPAGAGGAIGDRFKDLDPVAFSQNAGEAEVPAAVFTETSPKAWSQRTGERIDAVVAMKRRNRRWGCKRIAQQIALAFGVEIDKDVVRRILATHFHPESGSDGPSWLSFIGHAKDSLWSLDLFRCESAILRTYRVLVVMDQFTRRIVGFAVHRGAVDGVALCRMFNRAIHTQRLPKYLSSDHDPLYQFHQWHANLRVLGVEEIKTAPYAPLSHPFVERLIGTVRREYLDQTLFWTAADLEEKLRAFQQYFNRERVHSARDGKLPDPEAARHH